MLIPSSIRRVLIYGEMLFALSGILWAQTNSCDVNNDGTVNVVDVQLITNMEVYPSAFSCTANVGGVLGCTDFARQAVIRAAVGSGCHFIYLTWTASTSTGVVGYNIYRGTSSGGESGVPVNTNRPVAGTSFADLTAVGGTKYFYYLKATDGINLSPPSTEVCVITATDGVNPSPPTPCPVVP